MAHSEPTPRPGLLLGMVAGLGAGALAMLDYIGGLGRLALELLVWVGRCLTRQVRIGREALYIQIVRVGVRSVLIIALVSGCIGMILALQMAPPLSDFGYTEMVANIIGVSVLRELGPLISGIVLTGFAGASIAAELGTMVVSEELEALESMALNPVRFLVMPRVLATVISLMLLCVLGDLVAVAAGAVTGTFILDIPWGVYKANTLEQISLADFLTGVGKAGVFGLLIGLISCYNGLRVSGGAAGVGVATTRTVVHSIVCIIFADLLFTALFYTLGWT
ncbi:MAG: ABC transporter permease [Phycisphaerae bacterium]|nr:ABC transporter permease [Phycisphaerae bacterium]